jgi:uncharacterized BrkB/YihY/UPF0761 family membrane protein
MHSSCIASFVMHDSTTFDSLRSIGSSTVIIYFIHFRNELIWFDSISKAAIPNAALAFVALLSLFPPLLFSVSPPLCL